MTKKSQKILSTSLLVVYLGVLASSSLHWHNQDIKQFSSNKFDTREQLTYYHFDEENNCVFHNFLITDFLVDIELNSTHHIQNNYLFVYFPKQNLHISFKGSNRSLRAPPIS